jgi:hypothetical protein
MSYDQNLPIVFVPLLLIILGKKYPIYLILSYGLYNISGSV